MDELIGQFRQRLRERVEALAADRAALTRDAAARTRVRDIAHALKGSGGTYGFPEISAAAATVECATDAALGESLDALITVLYREAAPAPAGTGPMLVDRALSDRLEALRAALLADTPAHDAPVASPSPAVAPDSAATAERAVILIVDDDPDVYRLLATVLASPGRQTRVVTTAADAERALGHERVALIVLDLMLPDADGRSLLARLREDSRTSAIPVIVLSGHSSAEARTECYALGAEAVITKPFDPAAVVAAVSATLERTAHGGYDARLDPDTALPNRVAFREAFDRATAAHPAHTPTISIALLDLDQYRPLAASSGWGSAARALAVAARRLTEALPGTATLARWSGGALAALLVGAGEPEATTLVAEALRKVRDEAPPDGQASRFTFSAGVAEWAAGTTLEDMVAEAERQVVAARASGGDAARSSAQPGPATRRVVVLAEDDELIATVVKHRLEREGFTVKHFADGATAAAAAITLHPALAILDVKMPAMDGFELLSRLRAEPSLAAMPIMMLTSMGSEQDVVRGLQLGADEYVVKPFSPVELVARVHRLLSRT